MPCKKLFPYALAACFALGIIPTSAAAQTGDIRQRQVALATETINGPNGPALESEPVIISLASEEDINRAKSVVTKTGIDFQFKQMITAAIDQRLGTRYVWGGTGPSGFDCSGFVWATFRSAGIEFERGSARTLWGRFAPPAPGEQYKFGTLVFFSNLAHIGIVADENGFYHASRHHGVVYSPFNKYWTSRIDGFRTVPVPVTRNAD
ncbi:MAG TPA: C40 family peptidase [Pyrinomonadaceae bacterium]|nr:C40 family peptidase [Pyrinomonadaceae bacterium]